MKHSCRVLIAVLALSVLWCTFGLFAIADSSLKLPPKLTTIEAEAFCGSKAIGKVVLPNSVEAIYARAFADSTISEINLPKSLTYIDDTAFENVNNLIVTADSGTYAYDWAVENGYLTDLSQIDKLQFTELTTNSALILKTTTNYDFSSGDLKFGTQSLIPARLALPAQKMKFIAYALNEEPDFSDLKQDSRKVGAYLFNDNLSYRLLLQGNLNGAPLFTIKSAAVGRAKYVKVMIGLYADRKDAKPSAWTGVGFAIAEAEHPHEADHPHEASPVEDFVIQGGVITKYIGEGGDVVIPSKDAKGKKITKIGEDAFWPDEEEEYEKTGRANVDSVVIPEGVTSIAGCAFNRSSLSSITIPNSVKEIGEAAFRGCGFASIVLPNGLTSIRESTFSDCSSLVDISIPKSVTRIQDNAFNGCISLTDINIPDSVKNIGLGAFKDCTSLTSMVLPRMLTGISDSTFMNCTSLTHVVIPDGVASIGSYAFGSAYSLEHISIPSSVTVIGDCAFSDCHSITSINIPNSVTSIGGYAFEDCHSLSSISLSNKITIIAKGTFDGCHSLKSLSIPNGVTTIREAFYGCDRLEQLYIPASVTNIDGDEYWYTSSIFNDCSNLTIYCSDDSAAETYANYYDIKYKHGSFSAHSITDITITHDLQGSVLAKGSATGSFKMSPAAKPGATSTLKISCDADWDVALNNVEWMTAEKQGDNRVLLTVGDVEDGKYYSSILTFVVNGTDTYTVTVIMDRTSLSPEPEPTVNVGKPVIKDLTTGKTFEGGKTVSYDTSNGALSLKLSAENGCGQYKIVVIALNEAPDFSDENQAARRIKTVFTDGDGYAYNDVWSKQVYEEMIKLCKGIPISLAGLSNGQYLKIAVGAYARENDAEPKVWTNIGLKIIRNENEVKLLSKTEFMKKV